MARTVAQYFKLNRKYTVGSNSYWIRRITDEGLIYYQNVDDENIDTIEANVITGDCVIRSCVDPIFDTALSEYVTNLALEITLCQTCEDGGATAPEYIGICSRCAANLNKFTTLKTIALG